VLAGGPGWRWVFFVNVPVCVVDLFAARRLLAAERHRARLANFDAVGAALGTAGMQLLIYAIVNAPTVGWGATRTVGELTGAIALLALFALNERRRPNPLFPFSILRINGLAAADITQVVAVAGSFSMFFFVTLYMQNVLGFTKLQAGAAYVPTALGVALSAGICAQLIPRIGTRPIMVVGALIDALGLYLVSQIPVHGSYVSDLLPGLVVMSLGFGAIFVAVTTAAQAGVPSDKAGLAAALVNSSTWLGGALGLAIFSAIATSRTHAVLATGAPLDHALTAGFQRALVACSVFLLVAAAIASHATNTRWEAGATEQPDPAAIPVGGTA
jgi:MFS family permease